IPAVRVWGSTGNSRRRAEGATRRATGTVVDRTIRSSSCPAPARAAYSGWRRIISPIASGVLATRRIAGSFSLGGLSLVMDLSVLTGRPAINEDGYSGRPAWAMHAQAIEPILYRPG